MPIFGNSTGDDDTTTGCGDRLIGGIFVCPDNAIGNSMSAKLNIWNAPANGDISLGLYLSATQALIGYTEEKTIAANFLDWETFDFVWPVGGPSLIAGTSYYLVSWGDALDAANSSRLTFGGNNTYRQMAVVYNYPTWINPSILGYFSAQTPLIYCTYTKVAANPIIGKPLISPDIIKKAKIR